MDKKTSIIYNEKPADATSEVEANSPLSLERAQGVERVSLTCPEVDMDINMGQEKDLKSQGTA